MANRTTNERFSSRKNKKSQNVKKSNASGSETEEDASMNSSDVTSTIMTYSDFMESAKSEIVEESKEGLIGKKSQPKKKKKGCFLNCWKMATHTKILP